MNITVLRNASWVEKNIWCSVDVSDTWVWDIDV